MAINNQGSLHPGAIIQNGNEITKALMMMQEGLSAVNDKTRMYQFKNVDLMRIMPFVQRVEGNNNTVLTFEDFQIFFEEYSDYANTQVYNEVFHKWILNSKSYQSKNGEFTRSWVKKMEKSGQSPARKLIERTTAVLNKYLDVFLPNYMWEALLNVPTAGQDYYVTKGALRNTSVDASLLHSVDATASAGTLNSTVRNHFRGIEGAAVSYDDLKFVKQYLSRYIDVDTNKIVMFGNLITKDELQTIFQSKETKDKVILGSVDLGTGSIINGIPFLETNMLDSYQVMFMVADSNKPFVAQLVNSLDKYQGMNFETENEFEKFERLSDIAGGRYVIEDIGNQVISGHRLLFLDITPSRYTSNTTREMNGTGLSEITKRQEFLRKQWKTTVV